MSDDSTRTEADAGAFARAHAEADDARPTRAEAESDEDAYWNGPDVLAEGGVRCGACKRRHASADDVRWCYDLKHQHDAANQGEREAEARNERWFEERGGPVEDPRERDLWLVEDLRRAQSEAGVARESWIDPTQPEDPPF